MKKKVVAILLLSLCAFLLILSACSEHNEGSEKPSNPNGGTNVQETAVDEADIVKISSNGYIYNMQSDGLTVSALNQGNMKIVAVRKHKKYIPLEMYVGEDFFITFNGLSDTFYEDSGHNFYDSPYQQVLVSIYLIPTYGGGTDPALVLVPTYTFQVSGTYFTSRLYHQSKELFFVIQSSTTNILAPIPDEDIFIENPSGKSTSFETGSSPMTKKPEDVITENEKGSIYYLENGKAKKVTKVQNVGALSGDKVVSNNELTLFVRINLLNLQENTAVARSTVVSYCGVSFQELYATEYNLYAMFSIRAFDETSTEGCSFGARYIKSTLLVKLNMFTLESIAKMEMRGYEVYGRYALKENGNFLYVAATKGRSDGTAMLVFDTNLVLQGSLKGIAPREDVYSVRYEIVGEKVYGYIVTFRQTDPLFKIDLTNPYQPLLLGALKITGVSTYLHPFGDNCMIGLGWDGTTTGLNDNIKVTLFDTSGDDPIAIHHIVIHDVTFAEAINNPKAFCVDTKLGVFGFSVLKRENGKFKQGFYAFALQDKKLIDVAYLSLFPNGIVPSEGGYQNMRKYINRGFLYEEYLYLVADGYIASYRMETLQTNWKPYAQMDLRAEQNHS